LFLALRGPLGAVAANALALAITAVANTATNRRFTFGVKGGEERVRHHIMGLVIYVLTVALTSGALGVLHDLVAHPARVLELAVLITASSVATITRYLALRSWVFRAAGRPRFDASSMVKVGL
jgi:putative flippase GtrA